MNEAGIKPELEAFDAGMINYAKYLAQKGLLRPQPRPPGARGIPSTP